MTYEVYLPVDGESGIAFPPTFFRLAFDELAEQFGFVETWPVYRPLVEMEDDVNDRELYRFQLEVANTSDNRRWLLQWRRAQDQRFGSGIWMIRYRSP